MMRRSQCALVAVGALGAVVAALAACSGTPSSTLCGAGTRLVNGTCVAAAGGDGGLDAGLDVEVPPDEDGGSDADTDDAGPDDPCPKMGPDAKEMGVGYGPGAYQDDVRMERFYNCDEKCGTVSPQCGSARCRVAGERWPGEPTGGKGTMYVPINSIQRRVTIRLPRDPWTVLGGECDPDPAMRYPTGATNYRSYAVASPQPKFSLLVDVGVGWPPSSDAPVPMKIEGRNWDFRTVTDVRLFNDGNLGGGTRLEPLFAPSAAFSPFEADRTGCVEINHRDFGTNVPAGYSPLPNGDRARLVFFTSQAHIHAANLILDINASAKCGVNP